MHADGLIFLCDELGDNLRVMKGNFTDLYKRRSLKVKGAKNKVMKLWGRGAERKQKKIKK